HARASFHTHRPKDAYWPWNVVAVAFREARHCFCAEIVACCCAAEAADAFVETHLPNAFSFVPYVDAKVAALLVWSALQAPAAFSSFCACLLATCDTHLPNALRSLAFLPYVCAKAAKLALRWARQLRDGFCRPCCSACDEAFACAETQLPKAFLPLLPVP